MQLKRVRSDMARCVSAALRGGAVDAQSSAIDRPTCKPPCLRLAALRAVICVAVDVGVSLNAGHSAAETAVNSRGKTTMWQATVLSFLVLAVRGRGRFGRAARCSMSCWPSTAARLARAMGCRPRWKRRSGRTCNGPCRPVMPCSSGLTARPWTRSKRRCACWKTRRTSTPARGPSSRTKDRTSWTPRSWTAAIWPPAAWPA